MSSKRKSAEIRRLQWRAKGNADWRYLTNLKPSLLMAWERYQQQWTGART